MLIQVICPGCHARFEVSDKFAGREGPCPKCKQPITIPKVGEGVKIHERDHEGIKDSKGKLVLKPIARQETKMHPATAIGIGAALVLALVAAWLIGSTSIRNSTWILAVGAVLLAPPLVFAGYAFLRDDELAPYRRMSLWIRIGICAGVYAGLWGVFALVPADMRNFSDDLWTVAVILPGFLVAGSLAALATLDMEISSAFFHYCLYLLACIVLKFIMGAPW